MFCGGSRQYGKADVCRNDRGCSLNRDFRLEIAHAYLRKCAKRANWQHIRTIHASLIGLIIHIDESPMKTDQISALKYRAEILEYLKACVARDGS